MVGACCLYGQHIVTEVCVTGAERNVWIPRFVRTCEVVGTIDAEFIEIRGARAVLAIGIGTGVDGLNRPVGQEPVFGTNAKGTGLAEIPFVIEQLITGKRIQVNGFYAIGNGGRGNRDSKVCACMVT